MEDIEKVIKGLEFTKAMITFNPSTGEDIEPGNLNEANKTTYDACVGAIALLKEQPDIVRCRECIYAVDFDCPAPLPTGYSCEKRHGTHTGNWYCADGERTDT